MYTGGDTTWVCIEFVFMVNFASCIQPQLIQYIANNSMMKIMYSEYVDR